MSQEKSIVFFPSLSAGAIAHGISKNDLVAPGIPFRFWDDRMPDEWKYKYFLLTAGHHYKRKTIRKDWGLEDSLVFGDSGGFQIASGAIKWDIGIRDAIFDWLEENSDIACNLDIPPTLTYIDKFDEALALSVDNFRYFESKQTGKTKFLNVIQGRTPADTDIWYDAVKDFKFHGWCVGSAATLDKLMYKIARLLAGGEFEKENVIWIHLLGITKISDFLVMSALQHATNKRTGNRITISTDSSSPSMASVFGNLYQGFDLKNANMTAIHLKREKDLNGYTYPAEGRVPTLLDTPGIEYLTWDVVRNYSTDASRRVTYHNLHVFVDVHRRLDALLKNTPDPLVLDGLISSDMQIVLRSVWEMFESEDPIAVYYRYANVYRGTAAALTTNCTQTVNDFFELGQ